METAAYERESECEEPQGGRFAMGLEEGARGEKKRNGSQQCLKNQSAKEIVLCQYQPRGEEGRVKRPSLGPLSELLAENQALRSFEISDRIAIG